MAEGIFTELNLPRYEFKIRVGKENKQIYDGIRKKYILLTPEEWVRQNVIAYLSSEKKYPVTLMAVEKKLMVNNMPQRFDLLIFDRKGNPLLVAEFKAPSVKITQDAFSQVVRYNSKLRVPLILVSNGLTHFICKIDYQSGSVVYLDQIPEFF